MATLQDILDNIEDYLPTNNNKEITALALRTVLQSMANFTQQQSNTFEWGGIITTSSAAYPDLSDKGVLAMGIQKGTYTNYKDSNGNPLLIDNQDNILFGVFSSPLGQSYWGLEIIAVTIPSGKNGIDGDKPPIKVIDCVSQSISTNQTLMMDNSAGNWVLIQDSSNYYSNIYLPENPEDNQVITLIIMDYAPSGEYLLNVANANHSILGSALYDLQANLGQSLWSGWNYTDGYQLSLQFDSESESWYPLSLNAPLHTT